MSVTFVSPFFWASRPDPMTHHLPRIIGTALATIVGPKRRGHHGDPQVPGVWLTTTTGDGPNIGGLELTPKLEPARVSPEPVDWRRQITMRSCRASARDWMLGARYCSGVARSIWRLPRRLPTKQPAGSRSGRPSEDRDEEGFQPVFGFGTCT
ncbi:hypothetical protein BO94DRAFT_63410 [Aspergillus sclerotioniger CBS 115572]|uniref:Uncharacterized protein n=1 Tax=Aspergillus sclerotioniger CBS 115572 TaxID=1450535 RepID=A0A317WSC5_9EURO|nr:hypothetical protein BO94DRAFT_63410 [Aspergillus sclerotioniger CBS 115572]PWY88047.1 hypothetical protein BO94DRAFT_63410 [Aspergillus sclerotioniger CBS 115572]